MQKDDPILKQAMNYSLIKVNDPDSPLMREFKLATSRQNARVTAGGVSGMFAADSRDAVASSGSVSRSGAAPEHLSATSNLNKLGNGMFSPRDTQATYAPQILFNSGDLEESKLQA
jgi:hypothetical protein